MFLLLPGLRCMRRAASVTPLLRRDPSQTVLVEAR
jgi:hypothetical protein